MQKIALFDTEESHGNLLPLSYTRPIADFRVGIRTNAEIWKELLPGDYCYRPVAYQSEKFGTVDPHEDDVLFVNGALLPDEAVARKISALMPGEALTLKGKPAAFRGSEAELDKGDFKAVSEMNCGRMLEYVYDVFLNAADMIAEDFGRITKGRRSAPLSLENRVIGLKEGERLEDKIFLEEGAEILAATLNVSEGPIYIGADAKIMEGSCVRGPFAMGAHSQVKMGAKIYGGTLLGPYCKVGGELQNAVVFGYSNKAHDGYLGNAVIGEWCNIGAGVNASNLKNDYSKIRLWNYPRHTFMRTDLQFCGLIMGDHSKAGINCMFNTATVVGVGVNLHGAGFPRVFIPSFQEGSPAGGMKDVPLKKFYEIAERVLGRRGLTLTEGDRRIYERVYEVASRYKA